MKKYVPIVTDDPQDNVEAALNLVFVKDEEAVSYTHLTLPTIA